jgi:hypothetical protein
MLIILGGSGLQMGAFYRKTTSLFVWVVVFIVGYATQAFAATCGPATSQGAAPAAWQTYCWIDMSSYNNTSVFGSGQVFAITLSDGSILSFTLSASSPGSTAIAAVAAPAWSGAATGNSAFLGIPGSPILYTTVGGTVNLTLSNIMISPPNGVVSTGQFKFVVADAESSNNGESLTFVTNGGVWSLVDQVPPTTGSTYPTASGTGTSTFVTTGVAGTVGAYIMGSLSPSNVNVQLVAGGLQGVMFAVQYSSVIANKQLSGGRANPADQFTYKVSAASNGSTLATATSTGAGNGPFGAAVATLSSSVSATVSEAMAAGSVSSLAQYTPSLTCTNGAVGSPTVLPAALATTSYNIGSTAYGDSVACMFTNTPKTATVSLQKVTIGAVGGSFTFTATNLASAPPAITTTATSTVTPAAPTAINVTAFNTAVTITETPATKFAATSVACTDSNAAVTGNPASFGALVGNVVTIPAANVVAAAKINCVLTNTVATATSATIAVQKTTLGAAGGPFTFAVTNLASTPAAITTASAGTAYPTVPLPILATATGTQVRITETLATNFTIVSATCTDANAAASGNPTGTFGGLVGNQLTIPATNVRAKAQITCLFTNIVNAAIPLVAIQKITTFQPGGPFSFSATNLAGTPSDITTTVAATAAPITPNYISVTSILNPVTLTEAANSNFNVSTGSCTDTNAATSGNPASFGALLSSVITVPVTNLKPFAKIVCTFTNAPKPATFTLQKITTGAFGGPFTFMATNLVSGIANISTVAPATATPTVPAPIQVTASNVAIQITEGASTRFSALSATCTDANASFTSNPASFGSLTGNVLNIPAANVLPAAQINCTLTNTALPATVAIQKTTTGAPGGPFNFSVANLASAPGAITTVAAGSPAPTAPAAIAVSTLNSIVQVSENANAFFTISGASCTDANAAVTGNPASFGSLIGQLLTIPAANVLPAAQITCTFINAPRPFPKLTIVKNYTVASSPVVVGQTVTYTYTVANIGNVNIANIKIADLHGAPAVLVATGGAGIKGETLTVAGPLGAAASPDTTSNDGIWSMLAPGATIRFNYIHTVTQAEIDHG